jgi:CDI immunity proteins
MKLENNWQGKTILELEKKQLTEDVFGSHLTVKINELLQKPLNTFTVEDLRLVIGQQLGLKYLITLVIEILKTNLFAEGDFYEGDLLQSVLNIESRFWSDDENSWIKLDNLITEKKLNYLQEK